MIKKTVILLSILGLTACGTMWKNTSPTETALDQMLISTAADRAASLITSDKEGRRVTDLSSKLGKTFIDPKNFKNEAQQYALHAIRSHFLDANVILVDNPKEADTLVDIAAGALSIDNSHLLFGIPKMGVPVPFAGTITIPELPLYKKETNRGLAKFGISLRDAHTGKRKAKTFFTIGTAKVDTWEVLLFLKFVDNDLQLPDVYETE